MSFFLFLKRKIIFAQRDIVSETRPFFFSPATPSVVIPGNDTSDASSGGIALRTYRVSEVVEKNVQPRTVVYSNQENSVSFSLPLSFFPLFFFFFSFSSSNQGHRRPSYSFLKRGHPVLFQGIPEVHDLVTLGRVIRIIVTVRGDTRVRAETTVCIYTYIYLYVYYS